MQSAPPNRIVAQFPGLQNSDQVVAALQETGVLEFVDMGSEHPAEGTVIQTDYRSAGAGPTGIVTPTPASAASPTPAPTNTATPAASATTTAQTTPAADTRTSPDHIPYSNGWYFSQFRQCGSRFNSRHHRLRDRLHFKIGCNDSVRRLHWRHIGKTLAIVLDKKVISAPTINAKIDKGRAISRGTSHRTAPMPWPSNCATVLCPSRSRWWKANPSAQRWAQIQSAAACSPGSSACWPSFCSCCYIIACPVSLPTWR